MSNILLLHWFFQKLATKFKQIELTKKNFIKK